MTVYLIKEKDEIQIREIRHDQEIGSLALYGDRILPFRSSVPEALRRFNELPVVICNGV